MKADVFIPCFIDQLRPDIARSVIRVLQQSGIEPCYNDQHTCCGQIAFTSGFWDDVKHLGEKFLKEFSGERFVIIPSASCTHMIRHHYTRFFYNTSMHLEYKKMQGKAIELSDFLINVVQLNSWTGKLKTTITLHPGCSAMRDYGLKNEPLQLMQMISGLQIVEMDKAAECCGFGGSFSVKYPQISTSMALEKLESAMATGAEYIVSTEASCLLQLDAVARKHNFPIKTATVVEIMAMSLRFADADM